MNIDGDLRQCILKLANTYKPSFKISENFKGQNEMFDEVAKKISKDISEQLYPILLDKFHESFENNRHNIYE